MIPWLLGMFLAAAVVALDRPPANIGVQVSSIGDWILWTPTPDELYLDVPDSTLRILSPGFALGAALDERFDKGSGLFACLILEKDGRRSVHPFGLERDHRWAQFEFGAGRYTLRFRTKGKARNDLMFAPGVRVFAKQVTLGIPQGEDLEVAQFKVRLSLVGQTLRFSNFDGDDELVIRLETPDGTYVVPSSGETTWAGKTLAITPANVGTWRVRIANPGRQRVNSVTLRLTGLEGGFEVLPRSRR
jgi:hypothetical protein